MANISAELLEAAGKLGFAVNRMPDVDADALRRKIAARYSLDPRYLLSYQHVVDTESIHDPAAWSWLSRFLGSSEVLLLFAPDDDREVLTIPSGSMVVPLLKETTGFVFYLTPPDVSYLICFDDHDCLTGLGSATDWVRQLKKEHE